MGKQDHVSAFEDETQVPFAAKVFAFWLGGENAKTHPTDMLAHIFGHDRYMQLYNASGAWALWNDRYTPGKQRKLADRMAKATGRTPAEAWEALDLMNLRNAPLDADRVLGEAEAHFKGRSAGNEIVRFFREHPFLLPDLDRALRLRKAGKAEAGVDAAAETGTADILDAVHTLIQDKQSGSRHLPVLPIAAVYYAQATDWTAMLTGGPFNMYDPMPELLEPGTGMTRAASLLEVSRGFPFDSRLDHRAFRDIVRLTYFPIPESHDELAAAVAVHWRLRPIANERFGYLHPFDMLETGDWKGSWGELDALTSTPEYHEDAFESGFQRIAEFVDAYTAEEDDGYSMSAGAISFREDGLRALSSLCAFLRVLSDGELVRYLESDGSDLWESDGDCSIEDAIENFHNGRPKLVRAPKQEDNDPEWKKDPELQELASRMMNIVRR